MRIQKPSLFLIAIAFGQTIATDHSAADTLDSFFRQKIKSVQMTVETVKCATHDYFEVMGLNQYKELSDIAGGNRGMDAYYTKTMRSNPCFARMVRSFYNEIDRLDTSHRESHTRPGDKIEKAYDSKTTYHPALRATLNDRAGQGAYLKLEPGWLWKLAMKTSGGKPHLAMLLIGVCGNDDIGRDLQMSMASDERQNEIAGRLQARRQEIERLREAMKGLESIEQERQYLDLQTQTLLEEIAQLEHLKKSSDESLPLRCPDQDSVMFAPLSLGDEAEMPEHVKTEIASAQKPEEDARGLPGKAYHTIAAAALGCSLARCGVSPDSAAAVHSSLVTTYRAVRLCEQTRAYADRRAFFESEFDINYNDTKSLLNRLVQQVEAYRANPKAGCPLLKGKGENDSDYSSAWVICQALDKVIQVPKKDVREKKLRSLIGWYDAGALYRDWYIGGGLLPCTTLRIGGPEKLTDDDPFANRPSILARPPGSICGKPGWDNERCSEAKSRLRTWEADFKWTKSQHSRGAKFGAQMCSKENPKLKPDSQACPLNNTQPTVPPSKTD